MAIVRSLCFGRAGLGRITIGRTGLGRITIGRAGLGRIIAGRTGVAGGISRSFSLAFPLKPSASSHCVVEPTLAAADGNFHLGDVFELQPDLISQVVPEQNLIEVVFDFDVPIDPSRPLQKSSIRLRFCDLLGVR